MLIVERFRSFLFFQIIIDFILKCILFILCYLPSQQVNIVNISTFRVKCLSGKGLARSQHFSTFYNIRWGVCKVYFIVSVVETVSYMIVFC